MYLIMGITIVTIDSRNKDELRAVSAWNHFGIIIGWTLIELLVHFVVNANEFVFSGQSPKILFYKGVKWLKHFMTKLNR